jgi:hypothetical protein
MPSDRWGLQARFVAQSFDPKDCDLPVDLGFDFRKADECVELAQQLCQRLGFRFWLCLGYVR